MRIPRSAAFPLATLLVMLATTPGFAQESAPSFHERPFAVLVNRVTQADIMAYTRRLSKDLEVGASAIETFDSEEADQFQSTIERPVTGSLFFLQKAMMPSVAAIEFTEVKDQQEFRKLVRQRANETGGKLEGKDGQFKVDSSTTNRVVIPSDDLSADSADAEALEGASEEDADKPTKALTISIGGGGGRSGVEVRSLDGDDSKIVEENGIKYSENVMKWERYFRYHGHLSYSSDEKNVWDMSLPTRDGVLKDASRAVDMGAEVYIDRIPTGLKTLGWNMLYGGLSTEMQQRDNEPDVDYNFRSAGGQMVLAIAKAGMFDSDHVSGAIEFATEETPIQAHLTIDARAGSELSKRLSELSAGESRFSAIIKDEAAVTMHFAATLPEESIRVFKTGAEYLKDKLIEEAGTDVDLVISGAEIAETLVQIADQTNLECFLKLGWTEASGGVIYGGVRVGDNPELLQSVLTLLTPESTSQDILDRFDLNKRGDLDVIEFLIPNTAFDDESPIKLSHLYIAHANSCLWFCVGGETCYEILRTSIKACSSSGRRTNTRVFSAEIDLQKWLQYPQDDSTGLSTLPQLADAAMAESMSTVGDGTVPTGNLMQRAIGLGGRQDIRLHLDSGSGGLKLSAEIGKAFGNYMVGRWMQAADLATANIPPDVEEMSEVPTSID